MRTRRGRRGAGLGSLASTLGLIGAGWRGRIDGPLAPSPPGHRRAAHRHVGTARHSSRETGRRRDFARSV
eukprot:1052305-Prymnesium_polylepis.1